ncbi:MAG: homoserine kinase [Chloroflexi bacterium]|nr:homoserine kinase [Chloroflexota bacterium]
MPPSSVTVRVPATSANLGPGFDCLGLALDIWATITLSRDAPKVDHALARMADIAARALFAAAELEPLSGYEAAYEGSIPIARGLGASAVARAGGVLAANALAGDPFDREHLLFLAAELEGHADNVAPALFGGFQVAVRDRSRLTHLGVPLPEGLKAVLLVPELRMPTQKSRKLLPQSLTREDAVQNTARAALLVAALGQGRFDLLDEATKDRLHQPARAKLFPAMYGIFDAAKSAGAHCAYLSGGGSTICALCSDNEQGIADAMLEAARSRDVAAETLITAPTERGAEIVEIS